MSEEEYATYPSFIIIRHLKYKVEQKGFRVREITLATTLLDASVYEAEELASLYRRRWMVELHIRSLKTQMQMDHLRCKSPQMVRKEIHCHMIGYNLVRAAMLASALKYGLCPTRLSFTGAMQAVEEFASSLRLQSGHRKAQWENLLETISELTVGDRPGRQEKRELKRRQKNYKLMQSPRNPNRNRYATAAVPGDALFIAGFGRFCAGACFMVALPCFDDMLGALIVSSWRCVAPYRRYQMLGRLWRRSPVARGPRRTAKFKLGGYMSAKRSGEGGGDFCQCPSGPWSTDPRNSQTGNDGHDCEDGPTACDVSSASRVPLGTKGSTPVGFDRP